MGDCSFQPLFLALILFELRPGENISDKNPQRLNHHLGLVPLISWGPRLRPGLLLPARSLWLGPEAATDLRSDLPPSLRQVPRPVCDGDPCRVDFVGFILRPELEPGPGLLVG